MGNHDSSGMMNKEAVSGEATPTLDTAEPIHDGNKVRNLDRVCRLTVTIDAITDLKGRHANLNSKNLVFKVIVEGKSRKTAQIKGEVDEHGILVVKQSLAFDVQDVKRSALLVQLYKTGAFGSDLLGQCQNLPVSDLLKDEQDGAADLKSQSYELFTKDRGKIFPGKVLLQIAAGATAPEQKVHVFVGTWNVGNAQPDEKLPSWLPTAPQYDIVAIGAQECDYPPRAPHADCPRDWTATLQSTLGPQYKVVHGLSRGQMRLLIFVHIDSQRAITEVYDGSEATGVGHVMSNKGGICVSLKFWDTSMCFVSCHFAAHEGHCEARNQNYREIVGNIRIDPNTDILNQFHHVFWMGDLNYRIDHGATDERHSTPELFRRTATWQEVTKKIQQKQFNELLKRDELCKEREAKRVLYTFTEGKITFPPTFKMKRGTEDAYDAKRLPAWCDRILWSSLPGCTIEQLSYTSIPSISTSDHKPVAATFMLTAYALPCNSEEDLKQDDRRWHVHFVSLRARNLRVADFSGSSDPYVSFFGSNLFQEVKTKVKSQNLNPIWNPLKDIPIIVLNTMSIQRLEKEYLMVRIKDFDYTSRDDTLGYGVIPLASAVVAYKSKSACDFVVEISHHGCPVGTLEGTMRLTWEKNVTKKTLSISNFFTTRTQSMRRNFKRRILSNLIRSEI